MLSASALRDHSAIRRRPTSRVQQTPLFAALIRMTVELGEGSIPSRYRITGGNQHVLFGADPGQLPQVRARLRRTHQP
ncbi:hypothetical protein CBM2633_P60004 [Cupriavidus taiwanensis]|uniref:Uncharacterized protein n=2 Tax=Cupriavidus TaxID=106589 RepID=A0A375CSQ8_9BURK|nr:hypothetical protein CBM2588_P70004 [Cupriavidus taiwanensis]SOZ40754.1 hypothetical protein CBM2605_P60004 [Cupriavidus neocaledonicus]SOY76868.1 hypothetical protein CBM2592_P80004 [Cupriavidus taiwanensis]SOY76897.1 hypothetical protein CBM2585_P60004 [Cupriavidus taiwanensis]SOY77253.1 hypothetical protein CBM2589_P60004 [Cupriavidus taiwanensis]